MTVGLLAQQMSEALGPIAKSVGSEEAEGGALEEWETSDTKRYHRVKAGYSEREYHHEEHEGHKRCVHFLPTFHHPFELGSHPPLRIDTLSVIDLLSHNESSTAPKKMGR